jgi:hypothetical protein
MKLPSFFRSVVSPGSVAMERRVKEFREEIDEAGAAGDRQRLESLLGRPAQLGLRDDDVELELEHVRGFIEALALRGRLARGDRPEVIQTSHRAVAGEACYFIAPASLPDGLLDQGGKLFLTDKRAVYLGGSSRFVEWARVSEVREDERDLVLIVRPIDLLRFRCVSYVDTLKAVELSRYLSAQAQGSGGVSRITTP